MHVRLLAAVAAGVALVAGPGPAGADDDTTRALAALKAVGKEGKGNEDAGPAWKTLTSKGVAGLIPALEAVDDANPTAANWLRSAAGAIADAEKAAGRALPADKLEALATNPKFAPSARHFAYTLLVGQDPGAKAKLLPGFLNDKSADLRRDAIAFRLEELEKAAGPGLKADLERLFALTRDRDQVDLVARKLSDHGVKPTVTEHLGFVTALSLVGPFDGPDGKGYDTPHPPEAATAATGTFKGKDGAEVTWVPAATTDRYGAFDLNKLVGKHKNAVAYALAVIVADQETPCEVRVTSITSVKIFLNGKEIFGRDEYHHGDPLDAHVGKGTLKKGENVIVLKVCQNDQKEPWAQDWKFRVRVCDDTGGPLPLRQKVVENGAPKTVTLGFNPNPTEEKEEKK
jgi:hypothetical protein